MVEPFRPAGALTFKRKNWLWVPTIAATTMIPTVAEMTAASVLDITRVLFGDTGQPDQSTNRVQAEQRWGDDVNPERLGMTNVTGGDMFYAVDPQAVAGSDGKKAYETFIAEPTGFFVLRLNVPRATTPAAGQFVLPYKVQVGPSLILERNPGEAGEAQAKAAFAVVEKPVGLVAIAA